MIPDLAPRELTDTQADVLRVVLETVRDRGYQPTLAEIRDAIGVRSCTSIENVLKACERRGYIRRGGRRRRIEILYRVDGTRFEGFADKESI